MNILRKSAGAALIGGLMLAPLMLAPWAAATAQTANVAYAYGSEAKAGYAVFFDRDARLSSTANDTIRRAANAARASGTILVSGRADYAQAVKGALIREGVPAQAIVVQPAAAGSLPTAGGGLSDPANRRVEISF